MESKSVERIVERFQEQFPGNLFSSEGLRQIIVGFFRYELHAFEAEIRGEERNRNITKILDKLEAAIDTNSDTK